METKQVRFCGFGGQGIILAGMILGHAAVREGKHVASSGTYGPAARGGACRSDVVISDEPIVFPQVIRADALVAMSQQAYDRYLGNVAAGSGLVLYDQGIVPRETEGLHQIGIPATKAAVEELGNEVVANMIILGAAAALTGIASPKALLAAARENAPQKYRQANRKALELGFRLGGERLKDEGRGMKDAQGEMRKDEG